MNKLLGLLFLLLCFGCNQKTDHAINALSFQRLLHQSDQVVVRLYDSTVEKQQTRGVESRRPKKTFRLRGQQLRKFRDLFTDAEQTEYCCCPLSNYAISFVDQADTLVAFYADTTQDANRIRIYEGSFQYSFWVGREQWKSFF